MKAHIINLFQESPQTTYWTEKSYFELMHEYGYFSHKYFLRLKSNLLQVEEKDLTLYPLKHIFRIYELFLWKIATSVRITDMSIKRKGILSKWKQLDRKPPQKRKYSYVTIRMKKKLLKKNLYFIKNSFIKSWPLGKIVNLSRKNIYKHREELIGIMLNIFQPYLEQVILNDFLFQLKKTKKIDWNLMDEFEEKILEYFKNETSMVKKYAMLISIFTEYLDFYTAYSDPYRKLEYQIKIEDHSILFDKYESLFYDKISQFTRHTKLFEIN